MARNIGHSSFQRHLAANDSYNQLSSSLQSSQAAVLSSQLSTFQASLSQFSTRHRAKILSSPAFRQHFSQLCASIGVDPLGGGAKGLWDKIGVGDWYYALGVQVVDVCLKGRERGGGLVALEEVLAQVSLLRNGGKAPATPDISESDVRRAIETLEPLSCGYSIIVVGGRKVVRCSPGALDRDSLVVVDVAGKTGRGGVSREEVYQATRADGWSMDRVDRAVEKALMEDGMVWVDEQAAGGAVYWVPAMFEW